MEAPKERGRAMRRLGQFLCTLRPSATEGGGPAPAGGYDYIVVGGGTAGPVMAHRLSEDGTKTVLLLEAGPDYGTDHKNWPEEVRVGWSPGPGTLGKRVARGAGEREGSAATMPAAAHNWNFGGLQNATEDPDGRSIVATRGKIMGGSSSVNGHIWNRGLKVDFDMWAKDLGCKGWEWENCLPFFNKVETDQDYGEDRRNHGSNGFIKASRRDVTGIGDPQKRRPTDWAFHASMLAHPEIPFAKELRDQNIDSDDADGFAPMCHNLSDRERNNAAWGYLDARTRARPNLTIKADTEVAKVLFAPNSSPPKACGVQLTDGATLECKGEVILCASVVNSPKLLMLSGVGPSDELTKHQIPVVKLLEGVGRNWRDHPNVRLYRPLRADVPASDTDGDRVSQAWHLRWTSPPEVGGLPSDMMGSVGPVQGQGRRGRVFVMGIVLNLARSVGRLRLNEEEPASGRPEIDFNYLSDPGKTDIARLRAGLRAGMKTLNSKEMLAVLEEGQEASSENPKMTLTEASSDAELDTFIKETVSTSYHISGTCKMGAASDPMAVCDDQARVFGVDALRVVDCSLMPDTVRANLCFTVYMMAERIAAQMRNAGDLQAALKETQRLNAGD